MRSGNFLANPGGTNGQRSGVTGRRPLSSLIRDVERIAREPLSLECLMAWPPVSCDADRVTILSLPMFAEVTREQQNEVIELVRKF